jgi:hypothetical protein
MSKPMHRPDQRAETLHYQQQGKTTGSVLMAVAGLTLISGAIIWGFFTEETTPEKVEATPTVAAITQPAPEPEPEPASEVLPVEPVVETITETAEFQADIAQPPAPAIALADSDPLLKAAITELDAGPVAEQFASAEHLVERGVSLIDNLAAGAVPYRLIPIARPKKAFPIRDNGLRVTADPQGYERFDGLTEWASSLDVTKMVEIYREFEPAANEAYAMLGYEGGDVGSRLRSALRLIMTTPAVPEDAELTRDEAVWAYADPELEALPDLQKQLLRMGPENLEKLQNLAREISYALDDTESKD